MLDIDVQIQGLPETLDALEELDKQNHDGVEVGIVNKARYEGRAARTGRGGRRLAAKEGILVATVGAWLEFGTQHIRARRWFRNSMAEIERIAADSMVQLMDADNLVINRRVAGVIGERAVNALQITIRRYHLIQTGHLRRSIGWRYRRNLRAHQS